MVRKFISFQHQVQIIGFSLLLSMLIQAPAYANQYNPATGSGIVNCTEGGYFEVSNYVAVDSWATCSGTAIIPSGVTSIGDFAFFNHDRLSSVVLPDSVRVIGSQAFGSSALRSIVMHEGIRAIGTAAFSSAANLKEITIPSTVQTLDYRAFSRTYSLEKISFLGNAPSLGRLVFEDSFPVVFKTGTGQGFGSTWSGLTVRTGYKVSYSQVESDSGIAPSSSVYATSDSVKVSGNIGNMKKQGHGLSNWKLTVGEQDYVYSSNGKSVFVMPNYDIVLVPVWKQWVKAVAAVKPSITGTATATTKGSNKLTAKQGTWEGYPAPTVSLQWYVCTKQVTAVTQTIPTTCKTISKATKSTLAVTKTYKGKYLTVRVTGTSAGTSATHWLSKSTAKVK
jgi:hypothetical protein